MAQQLHKGEGGGSTRLCGQIESRMSFILVKCVKYCICVCVCVFYVAHLCQLLSLLSPHHPVVWGVGLEHNGQTENQKLWLPSLPSWRRIFWRVVTKEFTTISCPNGTPTCTIKRPSRRFYYLIFVRLCKLHLNIQRKKPAGCVLCIISSWIKYLAVSSEARIFQRFDIVSVAKTCTEVDGGNETEPNQSKFWKISTLISSFF